MSKDDGDEEDGGGDDDDDDGSLASIFGEDYDEVEQVGQKRGFSQALGGNESVDKKRARKN